MTTKKKIYQKEDVIESEVENSSKKEEKKEQVLKNDIEKNKVQIDVKKEIKSDRIVKDTKPVLPKEKRGRPPKQVNRDENGNRLTKKGKIDRRGETGLINLQKSKVYQMILENKRLKENNPVPVVSTPYVDSSDSDTEFDQVQLQIEPEPEQLIKTQTEEFLRKKQVERERQLETIEKENQKLKESFHYNSHLNRLQMLSTNVKLKF